MVTTQGLEGRANGFPLDEVDGAAAVMARLANARRQAGGGNGGDGHRKRSGRRVHDWEVLRRRVELDGRRRGLFE